MEGVCSLDEMVTTIGKALDWTEILTIMTRSEGEIYLRRNQFVSYAGNIPDDAHRYKVDFKIGELLDKLETQEFVGKIEDDEEEGTHFYFIFVPYKGNRQRW